LPPDRKIERFQSPMRYPEHVAGTKDYIGEEATRLLRLAGTCNAAFERYGYEPIVLPILEGAEIFLERSGEEIRSRMYILRDPRGREICLRPEMTISAARAFLDKMSSRRLPVRLSYQGDMFRYDKVKEGRYREFLQAGIEFIGCENRVAADVETLTLALETTSEAGVTDRRLLLGDLELAAEFIASLPVSNAVRARLLESFWRRDAFDRILRRFSQSALERGGTKSKDGDRLEEILESLGDENSHLLIREILSLFVEKEIGARNLDEIASRFLHRFAGRESLPVPAECLDAAREYLGINAEPGVALHQLENLLERIGSSPGPAFEGIAKRIEILKKQGVLPPKVQLDLGFRHGIEYYTGFIFEIHCDQLGTVSQVCGGGRYDGLLSALGAPEPIPAVGFAIGVERVLLALDKLGAPDRSKSSPIDAVLVTVGEVAQEALWSVARMCRQAGWKVRADYDQYDLSSVLNHVSEEKIRFAVIIDEDEARDRSVRIRDMERQEERVVPIDELGAYVEGATRVREH
jgi:ATP phosphoribosyltransferase regulatory subunit